MKTMNEFLIVASPPPPIMMYVSDCKQEIKKAIGHSYLSIFSKAHISLRTFIDYHTDSLLHLINPAVAKQRPFRVHVKDFGIFHHGVNRTIYLNTGPESFFYDLTDALRGKKITPHITIARNLEPCDFQKAWPSLKDFSFSYDFICDRITVLKRIQGRWAFYLELPFGKDTSKKFHSNKPIL